MTLAQAADLAHQDLLLMEANVAKAEWQDANRRWRRSSDTITRIEAMRDMVAARIRIVNADLALLGYAPDLSVLR